MGSANLVGIDTHEPGSCHPERERLVTYGASVLSDRELLTLLFDTGTVLGDPHELAGRLLARFRSVRAVSRAHPGELAVVPGVNATAAAQLVAAFELARRAGTEEPPERVVTMEDLVRVVTPLLVGQTRERLVVVICDRTRRLIGCEVVTAGSADRSLLPVREVMVAVLRRDGQRFALAHNHPGGDPTPSVDDIEGTRVVRKAATATGTRFLGHVVVADSLWRVVPMGTTGAPPGRPR